MVPPDRAELDPETNGLLALAVTPGGDTAETIAVLAHNPKLVGPFLGWAGALHLDGVLSARHHEILALRTAHNCGSAYEWQEHRGWAERAGLTEADMGAVARRGDLTDPVEIALVDAADELHATSDLADLTRQSLLDALGEPGLVEAVMVVGQYTMLSMLANATGLAPPTGATS